MKANALLFIILLMTFFSAKSIAAESVNIVYNGLQLECSYKGVKVDSFKVGNQMRYNYRALYDATIVGVAACEKNRVDVYNHQDVNMNDFLSLCPKSYSLPFQKMDENMNVRIFYVKVNDKVFNNLNELHTLHFANYRIALNDSMFVGCSNLKTVYLEGPVLYRNYTPSYNIGNFFPNVEKLYVNAGTVGIGRYAFYGCQKLKYVSNTFGAKVADYAFGNCKELSSFYPNNLKFKYPNAFANDADNLASLMVVRDEMLVSSNF